MKCWRRSRVSLRQRGRGGRVGGLVEQEGAYTKGLGRGVRDLYLGAGLLFRELGVARCVDFTSW